ncbi:hypothetical protein L4C42_09375 [Vibrio wakamikoensis]|uniref:hypothetical protein n=1 Tax=Vibrio wakamikoensis TaxID=2910251 RepID=UPI003D2577DE
MINILRKIKHKAAKGSNYIPPHSFQYHLDVTDKHLVKGWAFDTKRPDHPVHVAFKLNGIVFCEVIANQSREDLASAGLATANCAFEMAPDLPQKSLEIIHADMYINEHKVNHEPIEFTLNYEKLVTFLREDLINSQ